MKCPFKFGYYEFEGGQDCIGSECGMFKLCGANDTLAAESDVSEASMDANDGSELQDSREKLEVDVITTFGDGLVRSIIMRLLDRQAAITERECKRVCDTCNWPEAANEQHIVAMKEADKCFELQDAYDDMVGKRNELQAKVDELTEDYKASSNGLEILTLKNAELQTQVNNLNSENAKLSSDELHLRNALAQSEHELATLRDKLGRMLDNAHEITRIGGDC